MTEPSPPNKSSYLPTPNQFCPKFNVKLKQRSPHLINILNLNDEQCFMWSILAALHPVESDAAETVSSYESFKDELDFSGLEFPIKLQDIHFFEEKNNISVNVFSYIIVNTRYGTTICETFPAQLSQFNKEKQIDLFYVHNNTKFHYCWIKDFNKFFANNDTDICCRYCLNVFQEKKIQEHIRLCKPHGPQRVNTPKAGKNILISSAILAKQKVPFIIYADFECLIEQVEVRNEEINENEKRVLNIHKPCGFAYKVVSTKGRFTSDFKVYRGEDAAFHLVDWLRKEEIWIRKELKMEDQKDWIPVVFHCLGKYDSHIIIQEFQKLKDEPIDCLPLSAQEFISFTIGSFKFIDSYRFLSKSLRKLVASLVNASGDLKQTFRNTYLLAEERQDKLDMLLRKQVYPYSYFQSFENFSERQFPHEQAFFDTLKEEPILTEDYEHAKKVWETFDMQTLGDYHNLYVKTDVALLADVFEHFRKMSKELYDLDPANFYSTPSLAWQAALKKSNVQLELLTDLDMHLMIESGKRGGVAMIANRFSKANNPRMPHYDSNQPESEKWIIYLDANNLYGWAMSQPLPLNNFKWLSEDELASLDVSTIPDDANTGYILEVDLGYPNDLHDQHNDFPLAPEKLNLTVDMLSSYCRDLFEKFHFHETGGEKLIPNLFNKVKYVVHYRTLKLYLKLGMELTKVHRAMSFRQTAWLEPYIALNTEQRQLSQDDVRKDFLKFMNNSVYGKTTENVRNYDKEITFVFNDSDLTKAKAKPNFQECIDVNGTRIIQFQRPSLYLNKPVPVGFTILDLSKMFIYEFHYCKIKERYGEKAKLLFTDTDSLCYEVETEDIYADMQKCPDWFDFSNYREDHTLYDERNKNVLGKMKDETRGIPIEAFIGLKPKMYSLKYGASEKNTAVGVQRDYTDKHLNYNHYKVCLENREQQQGEMNKIESFNHQLRTVKEARVTLTSYDDKRYILDDGIQSRAYGHHKNSEC